MKKIISFLLACSNFLFPCHYANANSPLSEKGVDTNKEVISPISRSVEDSNKSLYIKEPLKEESKINIVPNEIIKKIPDEVELKEYQDDFEEDYRPSKWEMAKNVAI